ncbi:MAG: hypothetical protein P3M75_00105 [Candidatus Hodgkinia cicadicola]|nr:MAG: hypothetical protein P3M75_00105 [Candidatus Hodgkinia cicadicola]
MKLGPVAKGLKPSAIRLPNANLDNQSETKLSFLVQKERSNTTSLAQLTSCSKNKAIQNANQLLKQTETS